MDASLQARPRRPRSRTPTWWANRCLPMTTILDEHLSGPMQQRNNSNGTLVIFGAMSGLGDQVSGLLGGLALAFASGRRFEIGAEESSLVSSDLFEGKHDLAYSGEAVWLEQLPAAVYGLFHRWKNCSVSCSACCRRRKVVERPLLTPHMAFTYGYGSHHISSKIFSRPVEFITLGNRGPAYFRAVMGGLIQRRFANRTFKEEFYSCAVRHLLRPTDRLRAAQERLRPLSWPKRDDDVEEPTLARVGVHVRAEAVLINRKANQTRASYSGNPDITLGCYDLAHPHGDPRRGVEPPSKSSDAESVLALYSEYWLVSRSAEEKNAPASLPAPGQSSRWLLATDSVPLKTAASLQWPQPRCSVTAVEPTHTRCHLQGQGNRSSSWNLSRRLETVAEMLLLAEADILVHGRSVFAIVARAFCTYCRASFYVDLDPLTCSHASGSSSESTSRSSGSSGSSWSNWSSWGIGSNGEGADKGGSIAGGGSGVPPRPMLNASHVHWYLWPDHPYTCIGTKQRYSAKNMINSDLLFHQYKGWT